MLKKLVIGKTMKPGAFLIRRKRLDSYTLTMTSGPHADGNELHFVHHSLDKGFAGYVYSI